jgi:hypothetical protein
MNKLTLLFLGLGLIAVYSCKKDDDTTPSGKVIEEDIINPTILTANETWIIDGNINVHTDLTIEPGTTVKFRENSSLNIGYYEFGSLLADGTDNEPIIFTSAAANPHPGDWTYIYFAENNSASRSSLRYCTIQYCGGYQDYGMIGISNTSIKMNNCTVIHSEGIGITLEYGGKFVSCENNVIQDCGTNPVEADINSVYTLGASNVIAATGIYGIGTYYYSEFAGRVTWNAFAAPYILYEGLNIENSTSSPELTIMPGCVLKLAPNEVIDVGWSYYGKLVADGTLENPIVITSAAGSPSPGDWAYIDFGEHTGSNSKLNYCSVMYGGNDEYYGMINIINTSDVSVINCTLSNSGSYGIYIENGSPVLTNNTFIGNTGQDIYVYE